MDDLNILLDENIPRGTAAFGGFGAVRRAAGRTISSADLKEVDVLLVRSVTPVNEELLAGAPVRFVGSATTGTDHVDRSFLRRSGIAFAHAPGANAGSVVEYVLAALLEVSRSRGARLAGKTVGVIGCGEIGGRLVRRLPALGVDVLANDPPRAEEAGAAGDAHEFHPIGEVLERADIITLHTPLTRSGAHPTYHLIGESELAALKSSAWLINTCRGPVVDNAALAAALEGNRLSAAVLDVWENEPAPDPSLIDRTALATPHIAGYSFDGKLGGTVMLYRALEKYLGRSGGWDYEAELAFDDPSAARLEAPAPDDHVPWLCRLIRQMYDIRSDDRKMRALIDATPEERGAMFQELRRTYPIRRSFCNFQIRAADVPAALRRAVVAALDVKLSSQ